MVMITKEQYERMLPYEQHLFTAVNCDYARNVTEEGFKVLDEVFKEVYKRDSGLLSGCSRCRLRGLKDLGQLFFEFKNAEQTVKESEHKPQSIYNQAVKKTKATNKKNGK